MKSSVVIGAGFGDEGKAIVVDYLCSRSTAIKLCSKEHTTDNNTLVVRFSGGHQCSHTVTMENGLKHVFSNYGSGSFRGVPTYWSPYCTVEPMGLLVEAGMLMSKGVKPVVYIDERCPITTPYDIKSNQLNHDTVKSVSTCGVGFNSTLEREENHRHLTFGDLFYPKIFEERLKEIEKWYAYIIGGIDDMEEPIRVFKEACNIIVKHNGVSTRKTFGMPSHYDHVIFEGSQGLLLDQNFGIFPHVTRANTGTKNVMELISTNYMPHDIDIYLVTRAYQTRHGNGFMTNENIPHNILDNPDETNVTNKYQGALRKSLLDVSLIEYAISKDERIRRTLGDVTLVMTCLDHVENEHRFTYKDEIVNCSNEHEFVGKIAEILKIKKVYTCRSCKSSGIALYNS